VCVRLEGCYKLKHVKSRDDAGAVMIVLLNTMHGPCDVKLEHVRSGLLVQYVVPCLVAL
jgi:hypothetical protein